MPRIYTRKGDDGTTSLWYGGRVAKSDRRTEAYGTLDEAASALGVARSLCTAEDAELAADILRLQDDLFIAGAELATAPEAAERLVDGVSRVTAGDGRRARGADRPLHGPGRAAAEVRDPRRHPALRPARRRAGGAAPRRAARGRARGAERARLRGAAAGSSTAPPTPPTRWPASPTRPTPSCSPAANARSRRPEVRVTARRRAGYTHEVEIEGGHTHGDRRARRRGRHRRGPLPHPHRRRRARGVHRDHLRDVRRPQGMGAGRGGGRGRHRLRRELDARASSR